jgi:hypothetical protein
LWTQAHRVDRPAFVQRRGIPVGEEVDHGLTTGREPQDEILAGSRLGPLSARRQDGGTCPTTCTRTVYGSEGDMQRYSSVPRNRSRSRRGIAHLILHIVKHEVDVFDPRGPPPDDTVVEAFDSCLDVVLGACDGMISPTTRPTPDARCPTTKQSHFEAVSFEVEIVCDSTLGGDDHSPVKNLYDHSA